MSAGAWATGQPESMSENSSQLHVDVADKDTHKEHLRNFLPG